MIKHLCFLLLFTITLSFTSCTENKPSAKGYHEQIKVAIDTVIPYFINLDDDVALDSISKIDQHYKRLNEVVNASYEFINSKQVFNGETSYYNSAKELVSFYKMYAQKDIKDVISLLKKNPSDLNIKENTRVVFIQFYEKEQMYLNEYNKASIDFTYKYKIYKATSDKK